MPAYSMSDEVATRREAATVTLLIVDDEQATRDLCAAVATQSGIRPITATSAEEALEILEQAAVDVVLTDLKLPASNGLELLKRIHDLHPHIAVMVLTQFGTIDSAVEATRMGALDYVTKPFRIEELRTRLERAVQAVELQQENRLLREQLRTRPGFGSLIGMSLKMERVYKLIEKVSQHSYPVLVLGESGTGKELVARSIHFSGPRRERPFVPVDCSALAPSLIESELFGYVKGAFTGAYRSKQGLVESAQGGSLFLDEIGDLALDLQSKLLRIIQENEIRPLGSTERHALSTRVIAATHRNLEQLVSEGKFRADLYFRLNVVQITLPPLRQRKADIPVLASHFLGKFSELGSQFSTISDDAMKHLLAYDWPGNVRELENAIARASALGVGPVLKTEDLPLNLQDRVFMRASLNGEVVPLDELERRAILLALREAQGDKTAAARILGIGKSTLYRRLRQFDKSRRRSSMDAESNHPSAS